MILFHFDFDEDTNRGVPSWMPASDEMTEGANSTGEPIPDGGDAGLDEEVLRQVGDALLGDDEVGLVGDDVVAYLLDVGLLLLEDLGKVLLLQHLDVGLALALLVLEVAVEQEDARVLDAPPHLGVRHVLVEHDPVEDAGVLDGAAGDLLDLGVALRVDLLGGRSAVSRD